MIVTYKKPVKLWHVERSVKFLELSEWYAKEDSRLLYTKQQTVDFFALPDCKGLPVDSVDFGQPIPIPIRPNCVPVRCPAATYEPSIVVQYVGSVVIPASVEMAFGFVGPNMWGRGGELQWNVTNLNGRKIENLPPKRWPGN
ncbi:hypothetical protein [Dokdonella soli]|uniref:hypothetical protein n=1 Tax=Dokdonella soli TaxID=529810 RepID=UPI0031DB50CE